MAGDVTVDRAVAPVPFDSTQTFIFLRIANRGGVADTLTGAESPVAASTTMHTMAGSPARMQGLDQLAIPSGATVPFKPGSYHLMVAGLTRKLALGDTLPLTLHFRRTGSVSVPVLILKYSDAITAAE